MICPKCYNRGKVYQIDGGITSIKPCSCIVAKDQQENFESKWSQFKQDLDINLQRFSL